MEEYKGLSHCKREWKWHVVFISKWRRWTSREWSQQHLWEVLRKLAVQKGSRIEGRDVVHEWKSLALTGKVFTNAQSPRPGGRIVRERKIA